MTIELPDGYHCEPVPVPLALGSSEGLGAGAEARKYHEWQTVVFTLMGHAAGLYASGQHDMARWFYELAETIAREHVDEAHAVRAREVGVQQRAKYGDGA